MIKHSQPYDITLRARGARLHPHIPRRRDRARLRLVSRAPVPLSGASPRPGAGRRPARKYGAGGENHRFEPRPPRLDARPSTVALPSSMTFWRQLPARPRPACRSRRRPPCGRRRRARPRPRGATPRRPGPLGDCARGARSCRRREPTVSACGSENVSAVVPAQGLGCAGIRVSVAVVPRPSTAEDGAPLEQDRHRHRSRRRRRDHDLRVVLADVDDVACRRSPPRCPSRPRAGCRRSPVRPDPRRAAGQRHDRDV